MNKTILTPNELRTKAYAALLRELGPVDYIRFLQQFEPGHGDYTKERQAWVNQLSLDDILEMIRLRRQSADPSDSGTSERGKGQTP